MNLSPAKQRQVIVTKELGASPDEVFRRLRDGL